MTKVITTFREYTAASKSNEVWTRLMIAQYYYTSQGKSSP